jgi:hypothetical protein
MYRYINQLAASSREQSHTANFRVGAKVAAGSRNPHGLKYRSWHHGHGALVRFRRDHHGIGTAVQIQDHHFWVDTLDFHVDHGNPAQGSLR